MGAAEQWEPDDARVSRPVLRERGGEIPRATRLPVVIAGTQFWLWCAVDDEGEVLELLVQRRWDKAAAVKLMRKLLKKQASRPMCW